VARSARDTKLETRTNRLKLKTGNRCYVRIGKGISLGYRRGSEGSGNWEVRVFMPDGRYDFRAIGKADDYLDANGRDILGFFEAQEASRRVAEELRHPKAQQPEEPRVTVATAANRYIAWYKEHRKAYQATLATVTAHIVPHFGDVPIATLKTRDIRDWHHRLAEKPARKRTSRFAKRPQYRDKPATDHEKRARRATANRILTVFKAILNKAYHDELVLDNTAWKRVKPFENANEPVVRFLTEAEATRLINACRPDLRKLVKAALFTGARYSELAALTVVNVSPDASSIYIQPSKSGKGRHVPLSREGLAFFEDTIPGMTGADLVFTKHDGTAWGKNHHVRPLQEACEKAKIKPAIGFHELRHTYASLLAQAGADLLTISKLLGHADTRITSRHYAHLCDRTLANAVRAYLPAFGHQPDAKIKALR
jgi:integrase